MFISGILLGIGFGIGLVICASILALLVWLFFEWFISGKETP